MQEADGKAEYAIGGTAADKHGKRQIREIGTSKMLSERPWCFEVCKENPSFSCMLGMDITTWLDLARYGALPWTSLALQAEAQCEGKADAASHPEGGARFNIEARQAQLTTKEAPDSMLK